MRYGSVCSGIEAATVAWHPLGWEPAFFSEIEKFPREVLAHHYPDVPLHGDFTTIGDDYGSIDLLVGGTPCQSFSIAGLRKGLDDERGNLALEYLRLAQRKRPKWIVWENVPGVLSSNGGRDFGSFLGALAELGYGFAYRVLDAQYFGVAQRRRRVFVVGYLGDWRRAAAVLFERESLSGNPAPSREKRKEVAAAVKGGARIDCPEHDVCGTLSDGAHMGGGLNGQDAYTGRVMAVAFAENQRGELREAHRTQEALSGDYHILQPIAFSSNVSVPDCQTDGSTTTLKLGGHGSGNPPAVAYGLTTEQTPKFAADMALTLTKQSPTGGGQPQACMTPYMSVRRLTPIECERLQGFPDNYTNVRDKCPDGPRYKALGNSMAVPVMRWIGQRIQQVSYKPAI